jgi:hypothetical protein
MASRKRTPRRESSSSPGGDDDQHGTKERDRTDRGLRELVGPGRSQVGVSGALRARDVNRPSADDLAAAERDVVIVRRHWRPPTS